jgi:tetratricopeptide (TPR) repeat protein
MGQDEICIICLDADPPPIQMGCACRGTSGLAHIDCLVQTAAARQAHRGDVVWWECQTCKQDITTAMRTGLAEAWRSRVSGQPAESPELLNAESNLAQSLNCEGKHVEAEPLQRKLLEVEMRVLGPEHQNTLTTAGCLAMSLIGQHKYADAERIQREVLGAQKRVFGPEHPITLRTAMNLTVSLMGQCKNAEAEAIQREALAAHKRVCGAEHPHTLSCANNLANSMTGQGKHAEAVAIYRELLRVRTRVLGPEHPDTLIIANNLAMALANSGNLDEAEQMLQPVLAAQKRVVGPTHPDMLRTTTNLEYVRERIRAKPPTNAAAPAITGTVRPLPVCTRVLVQRLVAKPEYNGKRARVLSFDTRTGRYGVALDDGKELSLKPECLARAGCGAAGCASEDAGSVCARCHAVRYCSRECQRADWKAHKVACMHGGAHELLACGPLM